MREDHDTVSLAEVVARGRGDVIRYELAIGMGYKKAAQLDRALHYDEVAGRVSALRERVDMGDVKSEAELMFLDDRALECIKHNFFAYRALHLLTYTHPSRKFRRLLREALEGMDYDWEWRADAEVDGRLRAADLAKLERKRKRSDKQPKGRKYTWRDRRKSRKESEIT